MEGMEFHLCWSLSYTFTSAMLIVNLQPHIAHYYSMYSSEFPIWPCLVFILNQIKLKYQPRVLSGLSGPPSYKTEIVSQILG